MNDICPVCGSKDIGFGGDFRYCMDCLTNIDLENAEDYIWAKTSEKVQGRLKK